MAGMQPQQPPAGMPGRARRVVPVRPTPESCAPVAPVAPSVPQHLRPVPGKVVDSPILPAPGAAASSVPTKRPTKQTLTKAQKIVTPAEEAAFATIEADMGGRQKLVSTLSTAQLPKDISRILGAIADPDNDTVSLAKVCAAHDVSLAKLLDVFKTALLARGRLAATVRIASALPEVAQAVMDDAVGGDRVCPDCLGAKRVAEPTAEDPEHTVPCSLCKGVGSRRFVPDHEVQKTALKIGGLLEHGSGMKIAVNQNMLNLGGGGADSESYDRLVAALDTRLYGGGRARLRAGEDDDPSGEAAGEVHEGEVV